MSTATKKCEHCGMYTSNLEKHRCTDGVDEVSEFEGLANSFAQEVLAPHGGLAIAPKLAGELTRRDVDLENFNIIGTIDLNSRFDDGSSHSEPVRVFKAGHGNVSSLAAHKALTVVAVSNPVNSAFFRQFDIGSLTRLNDAELVHEVLDEGADA